MGGGEFMFLGRRERESLEERGRAHTQACPFLRMSRLALVSSVFVICFTVSTSSDSISPSLQICLYGHTRYDVDAAVGTSLTQSPITRVIRLHECGESNRQISRRTVSSTTASLSTLIHYSSGQ